MVLGSVKDRPVLHLRYSRSEMALETLGIAALAFCFVLLAINWSVLPDRIPSHFSFSGEVDGWSSKGTILIVPLVMLFLYCGLTALVRVPHYFNYPRAITPENAERQYRLARLLLFFVKTVIASIAAFVIWNLVENASAAHPHVDIIFLPIILGLLFGGIGTYLYAALRRR
ncbi:MAG: DUF1648 domain-containing protein [Bacteroidetes bacterium]|nr:DUF1648 domain-containing protein [Bacteroidota bacterium]